MIYVYRFLWVLFYIPVFVIEMVLFTLGILLCPFICWGYYIKHGNLNMEDTHGLLSPDILYPDYLPIKLDKFYNKLQK